MAHRLAELIEQGEASRPGKARETARLAAADLILRIWERRTSWPRGWPPANAATILTELDPPPYRHHEAPSGSPWLDSLGRLDQLHGQERRIWANAALVDFDFDSERRALDEADAELLDDERETLEGLVRRRERAVEEIVRALSATELPTAAVDRAAVTKAQLEKVTEQRQELLSEVIAAAHARDEAPKKAQTPRASKSRAPTKGGSPSARRKRTRA